jgi:hypothetical protein
MNRPLLLVAFLAAATAALGAQQANQSNPYQGVSNPPPDDTIVTTTDTPAKPPAAHRAAPAPVVPVQAEVHGAPATTSFNPPDYMAGDGTDDGIVKVAKPLPPAEPPALTLRAQQAYRADPDGDIVRVPPPEPGELAAGTEIRVELMGDLSSATSEQGEPFRSRVASDVLQGGEVLIPAGSEIDGQVVDVSTGHFGGHGTMLLRPDKVILPNGTSYALHAMVVDAPDSRTTVGGEGVISPDSRLKRDGIEYGGVAGGGVVAGALLGGPAGALAGGLVGAGVVTVHLLVSHPQAHLDSGTTLILTLTQRMHLDAAAATGN